jgi:flagellar capping protein FliD
VEQENAKIQSDILVSKRETFKTEEAVSGHEKEKLEQDLLIDKLNEQIKQLENQYALFDAQLEAQQKETHLANQTLDEAGREMEV